MQKVSKQLLIKQNKIENNSSNLSYLAASDVTNNSKEITIQNDYPIFLNPK